MRNDCNRKMTTGPDRRLGSAGLSILVVFSVASVGCDAGWEHFDRAEFGRPFAGWDDGGELRVDGRDQSQEWVWTDQAYLPLPPLSATHVIKVAIDAEGTPVRKIYSAGVDANWLVLRSVATRVVVEVPIPPADETRSRAELAVAALNEALHSAEFLEWEQLRAVLPENMPAPMEPFGSFYVAAIRSGFLTRLAGLNADMSGLDRAGFDRTWCSTLGGSIRVRNTGSVVRVETNVHCWSDPLWVSSFAWMNLDAALGGPYMIGPRAR